MKSLSRFSGLLLAAVMAFAAVPAHAAPTVIKVALESPPTEPYVELFKNVFQKYVEEKSGGRLQFSVHTNRTLGNVDTVFQGLQFGTIQMTVNTTSNLSPFSSVFQLLDLPYLFPDTDGVARLFASPEGQDVLNSLNRKNVTVLGAWPSCLRIIITSSPIKNLEDVQGMKLRTTPSRSHMNNVASLGMAPTPMPGSEILTGLQQGVVQGMDADIGSMYMEKFYEVAPYFYQADHIASNWMLICSSRWFNKLSAEDRTIIREAGKLYADAVRERYSAFNAAAIKELTETRGCTLTVPSPEEKARWVEKSRSAYDALPDDQKALALKLRDIAWGK